LQLQSLIASNQSCIPVYPRPCCLNWTVNCETGLDHQQDQMQSAIRIRLNNNQEELWTYNVRTFHSVQKSKPKAPLPTWWRYLECNWSPKRQQENSELQH
jgi:hypothetical protein